MRIDKPGVYNLTAEEYHADPCVEPSLSSSIAKVLIEDTPQHAWVQHPRLNPNFEREEKEIFDLGTAAHSFMLNNPKKFVVLQYDDWKKKAAQDDRDNARKNGLIPILAKNMVRVQAMVEAGRAQLAFHRDASDAFSEGKAEQTLIWIEDVGGYKVYCRLMLDWLRDDRKVFDDYKTTTSADPDSWSRIVYQMGHDVQEAFYRRGIRAVFNIRDPYFRFIVQETKEPFALCAIDLSPEARELADRKVDHAIRKWAWCRQNGQWPGYPAMTCTIGPPAWLENQMMAREERDAELAQRFGVKSDELVTLGIEFHKPI